MRRNMVGIRRRRSPFPPVLCLRVERLLAGRTLPHIVIDLLVAFRPLLHDDSLPCEGIEVHACPLE